MFTHFAGTTGGGGSRDGVGTEARFSQPTAVAVSNGFIYVADPADHTIRRVSSNGYTTTFAGRAWQPGTADGGGSFVRFNGPSGIAADSSGNLFVSDTENRTIRKITPEGVVSTFAGSPGQRAFVDGTGSDARFWSPTWITVNSAGDVLVSDSNYGFGKIRRITPAGVVTTLFQDFEVGGVSAVPGSTAFFYVDTNHASVYLATDSGSGYVSQLVVGSSSLSIPRAIAAISATEFYVEDAALQHYVFTQGSGWARVMESPGAYGYSWYTRGIAIESPNQLICVEPLRNLVARYSISGSVQTVNIIAGQPAAEGLVNATGTDSRFYLTHGLALHSNGDLIATDWHGVRRITPSGIVTSVVSDSAKAVTSIDGVIYYVSVNVVKAIAPDNTVTTIATGFASPEGIVAAGPSLLYVSDASRHTIERLSLNSGVWTVTRFAGTESYSGSTDGNGTQARFEYPTGLAVDQSGNLYVADRGNNLIRKITPAADVTTFAGGGADPANQFLFPRGLAFDNSGNLLVAEDSGPIRSISPAGAVTTIGGSRAIGSTDGQGTGALFNEPDGIVVNAAGEIFIADSNNHCIRIGKPALTDTATIDSSTATVGETRHLGIALQTGTTFKWYMKRQPSPSTAALSADDAANPTFSPDVPGRYEFELDSWNATSHAITIVVLDVMCDAPPAAPAITRIAGAETICVGESVTLQAEVPEGATFSWSTGVSTATITVTPSTTTTYELTVFDANGCASAPATFTQNVGACVMAPQSISLQVTGPTTVRVFWSQVSGATSYEVARTSNGTDYTTIGSTPWTYFDDNTLGTQPYLYKVRALHTTAGVSPYGPTAFVNLTIFQTDPSIVKTFTVIRAAHIIELRNAVNAIRVLGGLAAKDFTDATLDSSVSVRRVHIQELRVAVNEARVALGLAQKSFTDPTLFSGLTQIKAVHVQELRNAVK